jgi:uncharacterized membrane protein (UPF0127 family)
MLVSADSEMRKKMPNKHFTQVLHNENQKILLDHVLWCSSPWRRLAGLQFHRPLNSGEGILLVFNQDSRAASSIHMFFVFFPIAAIWINSQGMVTHKTLALPWRPFYASPTPAQYVLETTPDFLDKIQIGDPVTFT